MSTLDPLRLLAHDPETTQAYLEFTRRFIRRYLQDPSRVREVSQSALAEMLAKLERGLAPTPGRVHYWVAASASNAVRRELTRMRHRAVTYESRLHNQPAPNQDDVLVARWEVERIECLLAQFNGRARRALRREGLRRLAVVGGVASNQRLRGEMARAAVADGFETLFPPPDLCTDNAAMIAAAGAVLLARGERHGLALNAFSRVSIDAAPWTVWTTR